MVRKFFPLDKNYILEEAQLQSRDLLLTAVIQLIKNEYFNRYNPLRLPDGVSVKVSVYKPKNLKVLHEFYANLAAAYRYRFGDNQLEFLWNGNDHFEKYDRDWTAFFTSRTAAFCRDELFLRAVLDLTVFASQDKQLQLAENRMNHFIQREFEVKIHKQRGIREMKVA